MGDHVEKLLELGVGRLRFADVPGGLLPLQSHQHAQLVDQQEGEKIEEPATQRDIVEINAEEFEADGEEAKAADRLRKEAPGGQEYRTGVERGGDVTRWDEGEIDDEDCQEGDADEERGAYSRTSVSRRSIDRRVLPQPDE